MRRWTLYKAIKGGFDPHINKIQMNAIMDILEVKKDVMNNYDFKRGRGFIPYTFTSKMVYSVEEWMEEFENGEWR